MPAVTLKQSTTQSSQNCGVRIALRAETSLGGQRAGLACAGSQPGGLAIRAAPGRAASPTDMNTA